MVAFEDTRSDIALVAAETAGKTLSGIAGDGLDTLFQFDNLTLKVFPIHFHADDIHWAAWAPSGHVAIAGPGTERTVERASSSRLIGVRSFTRDYRAPSS